MIAERQGRGGCRYVDAMGMPSPTPVPGWVPPIPADFSQFFPDLIGSAVVGAVLAWVVIRLEGRISARREAAAAEREWATIRPRVSAALGRTYWETGVTYGGASVEDLTTIAKSFRKLAKRAPFAAWADAAPENRKIRLASDAARALFELDEAAGFLAPAIEQHYSLAGDDVPPDRQSDHVRYSTLRIMGSEHRWSLPWQSANRWDTPDDEWVLDPRAPIFERLHEEMLKEIGDAVARFVRAKDAFSAAWTEARNAIRGTWGDELRFDV